MPIQVNDTTVIDDSQNVQNRANTDASFVPYSNTTSELTATDVQAAIGEVVVDLNALSFQADAISYDPLGVRLPRPMHRARLTNFAHCQPQRKVLTTH